MKFVLRVDTLLAVTLISVCISYGAKAGTTTTTHTRRLRGKLETHLRTAHHDDWQRHQQERSHEKLMDPRPQHRINLQPNDQRINPVDTALIDPQEETETEKSYQKMRRNDKSLHVLPSANLGREFNSSLFDELHNAPFEIYESAFDLGMAEREESFPVFVVPDWRPETTGVFSAFSRTATPLTFQNMQNMLSWKDIVEASTGAEKDLINFINRNDFQATLFVGKTLGEAVSDVPFLGLIVTYNQKSQKNIMIPFAKLENFFHDTSEKFLLSESTQVLEHDVLHAMLDEERASNSTSSFFHSEIVDNLPDNNQKEELEDIEALHFRRLFQLLIRRTFLFSFGYADCLREEPHELRSCLDDTFSIIVQMEAAVRDAMDEQLAEELAEITKRANDSKHREACVSMTSGNYGMDSCSLSGPGGFRGLGRAVPISLLATPILR